MLRTALKQASSLLSQASPGPTCQQTRNTVILRRMFPFRDHKKGMKNRKFKGIRPNVFIVEEQQAKPNTVMEVLLTRDINGIGIKGQVLQLPTAIVRDRLLPLGLGVYNSPENAKLYPMEEDPFGKKLRHSTARTIAQLKTLNLPIPMNPNVDWVLDANHVRLAFRKVGVMVPIHAITIPREPITEPQDITINLRMNREHDLTIQGIVFHYRKDEPLPELPKIWSRTKQTLQEAIAAVQTN